MRSVYEFFDPIEFMRVRKIELCLSFSEMAKGSGIKAKSFFHKVLKRTKNYSLNMVVPIGVMLGLKGKKQFRYFEIMTFLYRVNAPLLMREEILRKFRPSTYRRKSLTGG